MKAIILAVLLFAGADAVCSQTRDSSRIRYRGEAGSGTMLRGQRTARFIDKDGDGICDERTSGLGVRRAKGVDAMNADAVAGAAAQGRGRKFQKGKQ